VSRATSANRKAHKSGADAAEKTATDSMTPPVPTGMASATAEKSQPAAAGAGAQAPATDTRGTEARADRSSAAGPAIRSGRMRRSSR
jgi:hypothetical protein